jgi:hypothetical protein
MGNAVKIRYKLKGDTKFTTCVVTRVPYENFKILPIITECKLLQRDVSITEDEIDDVNQTLVDVIKKEEFIYHFNEYRFFIAQKCVKKSFLLLLHYILYSILKGIITSYHGN